MADPHFLELAQATGAPAASRRRAVLPPVVNPPTNLIPHPKLKGSYLLVPVDGKGPAYGNEVNVPRWLGSNTKVLTMLAHVMVRRANVLDPNHVKTPDGIALREFISRSFPNEGMRLAVDDLAWFGKLAKDDPKKLEEVAARFGMRGEELAALAMTPEQAKKVHRLASQHRSPTDHLGGVPNPKPGTEYDRDLGREEDLKYSVLLRRVAELCGINMDKTKIVTLQGAHWSSRTPPTNEMSVWSAFLFTKKLHETGGPELMRRYGDPNGGWPHIGRGHGENNGGEFKNLIDPSVEFFKTGTAMGNYGRLMKIRHNGRDWILAAHDTGARGVNYKGHTLIGSLLNGELDGTPGQRPAEPPHKERPRPSFKAPAGEPSKGAPKAAPKTREEPDPTPSPSGTWQPKFSR